MVRFWSIYYILCTATAGLNELMLETGLEDELFRKNPNSQSR
jgi:hypothetical protein